MEVTAITDHVQSPDLVRIEPPSTGTPIPVIIARGVQCRVSLTPPSSGTDSRRAGGGSYGRLAPGPLHDPLPDRPGFPRLDVVRAGPGPLLGPCGRIPGMEVEDYIESSGQTFAPLGRPGRSALAVDAGDARCPHARGASLATGRLLLPLWRWDDLPSVQASRTSLLRIASAAAKATAQPKALTTLCRPRRPVPHFRSSTPSRKGKRCPPLLRMDPKSYELTAK